MRCATSAAAPCWAASLPDSRSLREQWADWVFSDRLLDLGKIVCHNDAHILENESNDTLAVFACRSVRLLNLALVNFGGLSSVAGYHPSDLEAITLPEVREDHRPPRKPRIVVAV